MLTRGADPEILNSRYGVVQAGPAPGTEQSRERSQKLRKIHTSNADRQGGDAEDTQLIIAHLGKLLSHAPDKGRGKRIGQPLHDKNQSNCQQQCAHDTITAWSHCRVTGVVAFHINCPAQPELPVQAH